jgi:hypothetical protein
MSRHGGAVARRRILVLAVHANLGNPMIDGAKVGPGEETAMSRGGRLRSCCLSLTALLVATSASWAGDPGWCRWGCPRSSYCPLNYLTPNPVRMLDWTQRDGAYTYAPNNYPEIPLHFADARFRCPQVDPGRYPFPAFELNPRWQEPTITPAPPPPDAGK